ncbi:MAG: NAD(P)-dependent oxidoreductase [bacterium]|nr:NAD(P)-dependent oxidoreductase [bacterium]
MEKTKESSILVTGGAGYIGGILVPELLRRGHKVAVLDNFLYNQTSLLDVCNNENLTVIRGDARDEGLVQEHLKGKEYIIPLACIVGAPACDNDRIGAESINLEAVKMLLRLRNPDQKIIFPNTNSGYGIGQKDKYCDETTPLNPISFYGQIKVAAEKAILQAGNGITLRLATVFGISPRMRLDLLVNDFVYRALNDKAIVLFESSFKRNYIHIRDVARAFTHAIDNFEEMKNEPYNVGLSDANLSKWELCEEIKKQIPEFTFMESKIGKDPDKRDYIVSNKKIELLGFKPLVTLQEGIRELIKGYQILRVNQYTNL